MVSQVLLLNASYEVLRYISIEEAITDLVSFVKINNKWVPKATVFESIEGRFIHGPEVTEGETRRTLPWPACIILSKYATQPHRDVSSIGNGLAIQRAVLRRDGMQCMYCGGPGSTVDHIFPESRGGEYTWLNLITACTDCNNFKADRTPEEAGMKLMRPPFEPPRDRFSREQARVWELLESHDGREENVA